MPAIADAVLPVVEWVAIGNGGEFDAQAVDVDGNTYVVGRVYVGLNRTYRTQKFDREGNLVWSSTYGGNTNGADIAPDLAITGNEGVVITGRSFNLSDNDFLIIKYSGDGDVEWEKRYNTITREDNPYSVVSSNDGGIVVSGYSFDAMSDVVTLKFSREGVIEWTARSQEIGYGELYSTATIDGGVAVTGVSQSGYNNNIFTIKYSSEGVEEWRRTYNGPANGGDISRAITVSNDGGIIVTGFSSNDESYDYITLKYSIDGGLEWVRRYNSLFNKDDLAFGVAGASDGGVVVTGYSSNGSNYDYLTLKYSKDGDLEWERRYDSPSNGDDLAFSVVTPKYGGVVVAGRAINGNNISLLTVKYSNQGAKEWEYRYNATSSGVAISIGEDSSLRIGGTTYMSPSYRITLIKLSEKTVFIDGFEAK